MTMISIILTIRTDLHWEVSRENFGNQAKEHCSDYRVLKSLSPPPLCLSH
jgi:hypothetical protein